MRRVAVLSATSAIAVLLAASSGRRTAASSGGRWLRVVAATCGLLGVAAPVALAQPTCGWVDSIDEWTGSFGWSWSHDDLWGVFPDLSIEARTQDAGSGSFLLTGFFGTFDGDIDGSLGFDDYDEVEDLEETRTFTHTVIRGPIVGPFPGLAARMTLQLDSLDCVYTWSAGVWGDGTITTESGSQSSELQPNAIYPGWHPIPELPGPLSFFGQATVTLNPTLPPPSPQFVPYGHGATRSLSRPSAPAPVPANVSWTFQPGAGAAPANDTCFGAGFLGESGVQDTSFATTSASDPASSCGAGDRSVWFFFLAPATGTAEIATSGSSYSTIVSVWPVAQGCGALSTEVACGSNGASVPVQANTSYLVQVERSGGSGGELQMSISLPEPSATAAALAALATLVPIRCGRARARLEGG